MAMRFRGCGYADIQRAADLARRDASASGFTGGVQYQYSKNKGTTQGSNEAATAQNTFDFETEYGTNPQDIPHTFNGSLVYQIPGEGFWTGGWRVGAIVNARSGVPINVTISRPDNLTVTGATVTNIPAATAAARSGRTSSLASIRTSRTACPLAQSGRVRDARSQARSATCRATSCAVPGSGRPT